MNALIANIKWVNPRVGCCETREGRITSVIHNTTMLYPRNGISKSFAVDGVKHVFIADYPRFTLLTVSDEGKVQNSIDAASPRSLIRKLST